MRLSLQVQYAICGMFDLAYNGHDGTPIQVRVIGDRQAIPARYLEQIFQRLRRARLVAGKRGPGGGYVLARPPSDITLRDIVEAVEGPVGRMLGSGPGPRGRAVAYRPSFLWRELAERIGAALAETNLETLCRAAARDAVKRAHDDSHTYVI
jgi:Rrf2 family iron-sulfur cluster assembly transcriptional regulator